MAKSFRVLTYQYTAEQLTSLSNRAAEYSGREWVRAENMESHNRQMTVTQPEYAENHWFQRLTAAFQKRIFPKRCPFCRARNGTSIIFSHIFDQATKTKRRALSNGQSLLVIFRRDIVFMVCECAKCHGRHFEVTECRWEKLR